MVTTEQDGMCACMFSQHEGCGGSSLNTSIHHYGVPLMSKFAIMILCPHHNVLHGTERLPCGIPYSNSRDS